MDLSGFDCISPWQSILRNGEKLLSLGRVLSPEQWWDRTTIRPAALAENPPHNFLKLCQGVGFLDEPSEPLADESLGGVLLIVAA